LGHGGLDGGCAAGEGEGVDVFFVEELGYVGLPQRVWAKSARKQLEKTLLCTLLISVSEIY